MATNKKIKILRKQGNTCLIDMDKLIDRFNGKDNVISALKAVTQTNPCLNKNYLEGKIFQLEKSTATVVIWLTKEQMKELTEIWRQYKKMWCDSCKE